LHLKWNVKCVTPKHSVDLTVSMFMITNRHRVMIRVVQTLLCTQRFRLTLIKESLNKKETTNVSGMLLNYFFHVDLFLCQNVEIKAINHQFLCL
jgi:hypothetical protein